MNSKPILFSSPMVRAILDGSKTQTRRVVKPCKDRYIGCYLAPNEIAGEINGERYENSKYISGDQLWVRETWGVLHEQFINDSHEPTFWRADYSDADLAEQKAGTLWLPRWRPSIHMFRNRSRITLEITGVRVEKLQEISEADAIAEGAKPYSLPVHPDRESLRHVDGFAALWESINGPGSWDVNPWVWVVSFERVEP